MQVDLRSSWWIRDVEIPTRLVLAPMAGVSVQAFRRQGRRFGAGLVCSEMVSCAGLHHGNERTLGYRSEEHTSELQSRLHLVCRLLLEKKKKKNITILHELSQISSTCRQI